ncbi:malonyl-ACP O-methyltransferase BioC [Propionivibrio sp.]|uniref:malonyl-ACP O-methyltransferase BioC n=1 Tax=Propionivibrio sp. TaxID=2212460 RepID=UPI003BF2F645
MLLQSIKQRIRESFDRAAATYDGAAVVQRQVCESLLEDFFLSGLTPARILDAGCGTGYGARLLRARWPAAHITGVDFAPAMLNHALRDSDVCLAADIEKLPLDEASFDLWWSSLTIQWCDSDAVFLEAARVLKPGGQLALSTLGPNTFHELRQAFASIDQHRHTLPFSEPDAIRESLVRAGFGNVDLRRKKHTVYYPDLKTLLRAVKDIGAHNVGEGARSGMMGRHAWKKVQATYEQHREPAGLPASYDVILGYARK